MVKAPLSSLAAALLLYSCAQVVTPSGGAKDTQPPRALKYSPDSAAVNFSSKNAVITFNEYIQLGELSSQLIVSPPMKEAPEVKVKGKDLLITFKDSLKKNTTYTLSFGKAVQDITESNPLENFRYVFSTGAYIDSLSLSGKVTDAFSGSASKGVLVMLYREHGDSVPFKKLPDYFAKTKDDGSYRITNIGAGKYKAFALKESNANYLYDAPDESIAFAEKPIGIRKDTSLDLRLFKEPPVKQFIKKSSVAGYGHLFFAFNKPVEKLEINALNFSSKKEWRLEEWNEAKDTLNYWLIDVGVEELKLEIKDNGKVLDTVDMRLLSRETAEKASRGKKLSLGVTISVSKDAPADIYQPIVLRFSQPLKGRFTQDKISLTAKDKTMAPYYDFMPMTRSVSVVNSPWPENTEHKLFVPPGVFEDIFGLTNDTINVNFKTHEEKFYGTIKLKISKPKEGQLIQLVNESDAVIIQNTTPMATVLEHKHLAPGKYKARIIFDTNKNGKWDTGEYLKGTQPEKVVYYPGTMTIRSNWDLEQEWILTE